MNRTILPLVALALTSACFVFPPTRMSAGGGGAAGTVVLRNSASELRRHPGAADARLRFGVTPMTLANHAAKRRGDFSVGWSLHWQSVGRQRHDFRHGPYFEVVWFRRQEEMQERKHWRFGPTALVELSMLADDNETVGYSAAVGGLVEMVDAAHGPFFLGGWRGEIGIGFSAHLGVRQIDGGTATFGLLSVEVRMPGVAALAVIPRPRPR